MSEFPPALSLGLPARQSRVKIDQFDVLAAREKLSNHAVAKEPLTRQREHVCSYCSYILDNPGKYLGQIH